MPNQPGGKKDPLLPGLLDVTLVTLSNDKLMLTGFERLPVVQRKEHARGARDKRLPST